MAFFDNLLKPEKTSIFTVSATANVETPSVGDTKMEEMMAKAKAKMALINGESVEQVQKPAEISSLSEAVRAQNMGPENTPTIGEIVAKKNEMSVEQPAEMVVAEKQEEAQVTEPKAEAEIKKKYSNDKNKGRELVSAYLSEINSYIEAGKELGELIKAKDQQKVLQETNISEIKLLETNGNQIKDALQSFLEAHSEDAPREKLMQVMNSYNEYKKFFDAQKQDLESKGLKLSNESLVKINAKKAEIAKMVVGFGGQEKIQSVLNMIRKVELVAIRNEKENGSIAPEFENALKNYIVEDLAGAKMLASNGNIVDIIMAIANHKKVA